MIEMILLGAFVGILSGFFGIGGGTILVPSLLFLGFAIKDAIGISVVQMVFSSFFGSYLNNKRKTLDVQMGLILGSGGFMGALASGFITTNMSDRTLELIFLSFATFALVRLFFKIKEDAIQRDVNPLILFTIGVVLGVLGILIGVGGSILLVPILVGFLHVELKKAISAGLFFVAFSSVSGLISHTLSRGVDFHNGILVGSASLFGVYIGIFLKHKTHNTLQRKLLVGFYLLIVIYLAKRVLA